MRKKVEIEGVGQVTLTDKNYLASGGEASVYVKKPYAIKVYHDPAKMIHPDKIKELQRIQAANVLIPSALVRDYKTGKAIGYVTDFKDRTHPICKLFTKAFRTTNNVDFKSVQDLVEKIQKTVSKIHTAKCLVVDMNEMNLLVSSTFKTPYFIDVDSYQTPHFRATAIMESIRDRQVKNNQWTEHSDWFSFAVIAFQLYIGIHPYKGRHPDYKISEWAKRMDAGISVFDNNVTLPKVCYPVSVIPKRHLEWFKAVFVDNDRSIPPLPDMSVPIPVVTTFVRSTSDFDVTLAYEFNKPINNFTEIMGVSYFICDNTIHAENKAYKTTGSSSTKIMLASTESKTPVVCKLSDQQRLTFELLDGSDVGQIAAVDAMCKNGCVYSIYQDCLTENTFLQFNNKVVQSSHFVGSVLPLSTKMFDGVIFQNILGKIYITLPYQKGSCLIKETPELNGYRILEAKAEQNICAVLAEKKGVYTHFTFTFDEHFAGYHVDTQDNVAYAPVNFTVLPNGVCLMVVNSEIRLFKGSKGKTFKQAPFNANTKLFNKSGRVHFIDGEKVYSVKMK